MKKLVDFLAAAKVDLGLLEVLLSLENAVSEISGVVKFADTSKAETENSFGEQQMAMDLVAEGIVQRALKKNPHVGLIASEELPDQLRIADGEYAVCYDPLDGSSLIDVNLAVGSIFGIYRTTDFLQVRGEEMLAAVIAVYGPRTSLVVTTGAGVHEFIMDYDGHFVLANENLQVGEGKMFSPGNLRATSERSDYLKLMQYWCENQYTLRYSGGMVPDVNQILLKGKGIFAYPGYSEQPQGKLRLLFECAPIAFLMEQAGGAASDGYERILAKKVEKLQQTTPIFVGSKGEVRRCEEFLSNIV